MTKDTFQQLISFCQNRREREVLTFTVCKASGLSSTGMRKHAVQSWTCFSAINASWRQSSAGAKHTWVRSWARYIRAHATVRSCEGSDSSSSEGDSGSESESACPEQPSVWNVSLIAVQEAAADSGFNWFQVVDSLTQYGDAVESEVEKSYPALIASEEENELLTQSHSAYLATTGRQQEWFLLIAKAKEMTTISTCSYPAKERTSNRKEEVSKSKILEGKIGKVFVQKN